MPTEAADRRISGTGKGRMGQALLITLREGLEMALILIIVLSYVKGIGRTDLFPRIWLGVALAAIPSVLAGGILFSLGKGLEGKSEEVFEGFAMLLAVLVLSWMIVWMKTHSAYIRSGIEGQLGEAISRGSVFALVAIPFLAVGREGVETALFLFTASKTASPLETTVGGFLGLSAAIALGWMLYHSSRRINLRALFNVTGILLILFAAGLLAHGIHELQEAGLLPIVIEHVWDTNGVLDEKSQLGSMLKGLFGYNGNPSLVEVIAYPVYAIVALVFFVRPVPRLEARTPRQVAP